MLAVACAGVVALSLPAYGKPPVKGATVQKQIDTKRAKAAVKQDPIKRARAMRTAQTAAGRLRNDDSGALLAQPPISQLSARPTFGWPALVTEARKYLGTNPTAMNARWCARFMNLVLIKAGYSGTGSDAARSFASYGRRVSEPRVGAIAVLSRGKNRNLGHVGIVTGIDPHGNPIIISGNHGRRVGEGIYPRNHVIAYVMPAEQPQLARATGGAVSDAEREGIASPIAELLAAINAETPREQRREPQAPPVPERIIEQTPQAPPVRALLVEQMPPVPPMPVQQIRRADPVPQTERRNVQLDPALARLLGIKNTTIAPRRRVVTALPR
jgi:uncharacterized protein (TIGR02594 family)